MTTRRKPMLLALALLAAGSTALAAKPGWDQLANIKVAAERLAQLQRARGALGTFKFISDCYRTHGLASAYSEYFEACIVQDYIHSILTASVYQRIPKDARERMGAPEPDALVAAMKHRISEAFARYKVPPAEARAFILLIDQQGLKVFGEARFPEGPAPAEQPEERKPVIPREGD
jgi:hypothetical protein